MAESKPPQKPNVLDALIWWSQLVIAVLVVPVFGMAVAIAIPGGEMQKAAAFMMTCWVSVWLGMRLMNKAHTAKRDDRKDS